MRRENGAAAAVASPIGELVRDLLRVRGLTRRSHPVGLTAAWAEAVGVERAAGTRVSGLKGGVLTVEVESAALRCELQTFYHDDLIDRLRVRHPKFGVRRIAFRPLGRR